MTNRTFKRSSLRHHPRHLVRQLFNGWPWFIWVGAAVAVGLFEHEDAEGGGEDAAAGLALVGALGVPGAAGATLFPLVAEEGLLRRAEPAAPGGAALVEAGDILEEMDRSGF